ncbi:putative F-box protein [Cardamine amara subsp. amara]|uniref:F-box protein n=1 Tax=Cardamine amara subsp. amara TaxID=228776 RepID=A0ABD0ZLY3_CARAN
MASSSRSRWEQHLSLPMKDGDPRNWADLPAELTSSILLRLTTVEILKNAQKVCRSWRRVCKDPSMWIKIDLRNPGIFGYDWDMMCRHAVALSEGGLLEINFEDYATNSLLSYVAERSSNLRRLKLAMSYPLVTGKGFSDAVMKLPFLEHLEISERELKLDLKDIEAIGRSCPLLKTLKLNRPFFMPDFEDERDKEALAISETMPELRHLELFGNGLTNSGLIAILDRCLHLEHLNLGYCFNIDLVGDLEKRCVERIKYFIRPSKPTDTDSAEEDDDHSNGSDDMVYLCAVNAGDDIDHSSNGSDDMVHHYADNAGDESDHSSNDSDDDHSSNDSDDDHSSNDSDDDHSSNDSDDDHSSNDSDDDHSSNDSDDDHSSNDSDDDHFSNDSDDDHSSNDSDDMVYIYPDSGGDDSDHSSND